jgi:hypothetical protein
MREGGEGWMGQREEKGGWDRGRTRGKRESNVRRGEEERRKQREDEWPGEGGGGKREGIQDFKDSAKLLHSTIASSESLSIF